MFFWVMKIESICLNPYILVTGNLLNLGGAYHSKWEVMVHEEKTNYLTLLGLDESL